MNAVTTSARRTRSFRLRVFGCQMNVYDGELMRSAFLKRGWTEAADDEPAELYLFHTCSVREQAEERVHGLLGELRRRKKEAPDTVVAVVGCMADREGIELFDREPHVDIVCGSRHFPKLPDLVARVVGGEERVCELGDAADRVDAPIRDMTGRPESWHAHVAVMRGCDLNCTYCVVPGVRGRVESRPLEQILDEVRRLVEDGVREVHLLGQTIDAYGRDLPKSERPSLAALLRALDEIDGLDRVRMITLHPSYVDQELVTAMAESSKFMRFLPVPVQSGSDTVLRSMKRGYSMELYRRKVDLLRGAMPDLELISDWIVGFPGETDADFEASEAAMREFGFLQSYVFQYSPRPGTTAWEVEDSVAKEVKAKRNHRLLALQREIARTRTPQMVGKRSRMLLERHAAGELDAPVQWLGRIHNGHYALLPDQPGMHEGMTVPVELLDWNGRDLVARLDGVLPEPAPELAAAAAQSGGFAV